MNFLKKRLTFRGFFLVQGETFSTFGQQFYTFWISLNIETNDVKI